MINSDVDVKNTNNNNEGENLKNSIANATSANPSLIILEKTTTGPKIIPSAFPLITNKFYSIYNMIYSLDPAFEESLIANTMTSLSRSRVDSLNFHFPDVDEMTIQSFNYSHDLLMRIDHLFR